MESITKAVTKRLEAATDKKFITQTWEIYYDNFGYSTNTRWWDGTKDGAIGNLIAKGNKLELPFGPLQSISEFVTIDDEDTEYAFTGYQADTVSDIGSVVLKTGYTWPTTVLRPINGIKITGIFGYGAATLVPDEIKEAIKSFAAYAYEHRGDELIKIPGEVMLMIEPYRRIKI